MNWSEGLQYVKHDSDGPSSVTKQLLKFDVLQENVLSLPDLSRAHASMSANLDQQVWQQHLDKPHHNCSKTVNLLSLVLIIITFDNAIQC